MYTWSAQARSSHKEEETRAQGLLFNNIGKIVPKGKQPPSRSARFISRKNDGHIQS